MSMTEEMSHQGQREQMDALFTSIGSSAAAQILQATERDGLHKGSRIFPIRLLDHEEGDAKDTIKMQALTTPAEAGRLLKVHAKTVIKLAREGELPGLRIGKHWRFRNSDLEAWAENRIQSPRQPAE